MTDLQKINQIPVVSQLLNLVCRNTGMGFSAITRVTPENWIACAVRDSISMGLKPGDVLEVTATLCNEVRLSEKPVAVDHVAEDTAFRDHPAPALMGIQSYISVPIHRRNGDFFGTLCAFDPMPSKVNTEEVLGSFAMYADLISFHLDSVDSLHSFSEQDPDILKKAALREEFISVLGHDLKNPLATARMSSEILLKVSQNEMITRHANMIKATTYRMEGMIENLLDFTRGLNGSSIKLKKENSIPELEKTIQQMLREIGIISPQRQLVTDINLEDSFPCDTGRIGQLLFNLLINADKYGAEDTPITVKARSQAGNFRLSVSSRGTKIPEEILTHLFDPFYQANGDSGRKGLGLGLHIASEIAKAHGGKVEITSDDEITSLIFSCGIQPGR